MVHLRHGFWTSFDWFLAPRVSKNEGVNSNDTSLVDPSKPITFCSKTGLASCVEASEEMPRWSYLGPQKHSKTVYKESVYFAALRINTVSNNFYYILLHSNTLILQVVLHSNIFFVQSVLHSKNVGNIIHDVSYILKPIFYYLYIDIPPSYDNCYNSEFF